MSIQPFKRSIHSTAAASLLGLCAVMAATPARAATQGFIEALGRTDIAYDTAHDVLYISGTDALRRFDMRSGTFLAPIVLGGTTMGMDISPDGKTLAVANAARTDSASYVDLVSLDTGATSRVSFARPDAMEGGTFTVAYDAQGKLLASNLFEGSGWTTLKKYDPLTQTVSILGGVTQSVMLAASADRSVIGVAEANISDGRWGVYRSGDTSYASRHQWYDPVTGGTSWFNFEIGVSRDGSQIAIPTYFSTFVGNADEVRPSIGEYGVSTPIGVGYSPTADRVFLPFSNTNELREYDTRTLQEVGRYVTPGNFDWNGNWAFQEGRTKVAGDGTYVFSTVDDGVFFARLAPGIAAPVPEPESIAMLLLGAALVSGTAARRAKAR